METFASVPSYAAACAEIPVPDSGTAVMIIAALKAREIHCLFFFFNFFLLLCNVHFYPLVLFQKYGSIIKYFCQCLILSFPLLFYFFRFFPNACNSFFIAVRLLSMILKNLSTQVHGSRNGSFLKIGYCTFIS